MVGRLRRALTLAASALVAVQLAGCGGSAEPAPDDAGLESAAPPRDLLIVVLDTLRADALSSHGYPRATTPHIDAFAVGARRVTGAVAPASYTLASTASLLTGLRPAAHRVLGLASNVLPESAVTLAERLAADGFATLGLSCNPHVVPAGGFDQGFERFRFHVRDRFDAHTVPAAVSTELIEWWRTERDRRRFAYVHVLPPHSPYDPPQPFAERFGADGTERAEGFTENVVAAKQRTDWSPADPLVERMRARYDAGLAYVDDWFGALLAELEPELGQAAVVLLSDHGEAFGEHGQVSHGGNVWPESVHVPLIVRAPGLGAGAVPLQLGTIDAGATLLELLGLGQGEFHGQSFLGALRGEAQGGPAAIVSRSEGQYPLWSLRRGDWTVVRHDRSDRTLLFDAGADPGERRDLAPSEPARAAALASELRELLAADRAGRLSASGPRQHEAHSQMLIELGYAAEDEQAPAPASAPTSSGD